MTRIELEELELKALHGAAPLLAGICRFKKKHSEEQELEQQELELNRNQLILQTIQLTQQALLNSLKLEPYSLQALQSTIKTEKPTIKKDKPTIQTEQPTSKTEKPTTQTEKPTTKPKKPTIKEPTTLELTPLEDFIIHSDQAQAQAQAQDHPPQFDLDLIHSQLQIKQKSINQWVKLVLKIDQEPDSESEDLDPLADDQDPLSIERLADDDEFDGEFDDDDDDLDFIYSDDLSSLDSDPSLPACQPDLNQSYTTALNDADSTSCSSSSSPIDLDIPTKKNKHPSKPASALNNGFFDLAEFESEVNQGENQMKKKLRRLKSHDQLFDQDSDEDDDDEDIDLFAACDAASLDEDDDDHDGEGQDDSQNVLNLDSVADLRYNDFFAPIRGKGPAPNPKKSERPDEMKRKKVAKQGSEKNAAAGNDDEEGQSKHESNQQQSDSSKLGRVKFLGEVKVQEIPAKNKGLRVSELFGDDDDADFDDDIGEHIDATANGLGSDQDSSGLSQLYDDEDDENMEEEYQEGGDDDDDDDDMEAKETKTMSRLDSELFDNPSDEEDDDRESSMDEELENDQNVSRHAQKMKILSKEIARLEAENVAKKDWMLKGEASSKDRPQNSLLEQDLEFEHVQKIAPAVTEQKTASLESLIKQRILEGNYDDVVRKRPIDPKAFLPSRLLELSDAQPTRSLTEIYEDTYQNQKKQSETGVKPTDVRDEKLQKEHSEIKELFESLSNKLDGLSNAHFTPPAPKATIKTINNLPTVALESSLPTATGSGTLLAPEEIFSVDSLRRLVVDTEALTHAQKQNLRTQAKKHKKTLHRGPNPPASSSPHPPKNLARLSTKDQKQISLDHLAKISQTHSAANPHVTLLNKRGAAQTDKNSHPKHRKLADGSAFKL